MVYKTRPPAFIALFSNTAGDTNTGVGVAALVANTTGSSNIAVGDAL